MQIGISTSISQLRVGAAAGPPWLIDGGVWNDAGIWDDTATWDDGPITWTNPDLTTASYDSVSLSVASQSTLPAGGAFSTDGTKFYVVNLLSPVIYQYNLSTAWDLTSASYSQNKDISSTCPGAFHIRFKDDGTRLFVSDGASPARVFEWDLSTAWDITTATHNAVTLTVNSQDSTPLGLEFNYGGTKLYIVGDSSDSIYQYDLTSAYDLSTASYASKSFSVGTQDATPRAMAINPDSDKIWVLGETNDTVFQYSLSTAGDISTASYDSVSFSVVTQENNPFDILLKSDGSKMYILGAQNDSLFQYSVQELRDGYI